MNEIYIRFVEQNLLPVFRENREGLKDWERGVYPLPQPACIDRLYNIFLSELFEFAIQRAFRSEKIFEKLCIYLISFYAVKRVSNKIETACKSSLKKKSTLSSLKVQYCSQVFTFESLVVH